MNESPVLGAVVRHKQKERDELQREVDEFHARGGKTQHLQPGESSGFTTELGATYQRRKRK
ncbi:hypothetical protein AXL3_61 [Stenotrophomonas phage vB_SmaS-AXL_3]|uniref:Uncharacterized protein n=1 Tax=Stenotrophomonas phage vB_SmaS-AXL_3 TaxID=2740427 RepID=A0A7D5BVY0_9CAUD|nr:hypothetical protein PQE62_gp61 [Stenotrophomonas phage vB_SmaS-AXL_3]QKW95622.1 hypothetical protein AXL3_61 [Stenotrophomonas phage vB_SmaS-AXL_3]